MTYDEIEHTQKEIIAQQNNDAALDITVIRQAQLITATILLAVVVELKSVNDNLENLYHVLLKE